MVAAHAAEVLILAAASAATLRAEQGFDPRDCANPKGCSWRGSGL
jgi:hypothetical protein